jgi:hypothetical protein
MKVKIMKKNQIGKYDPILNLWKDKEDKWLPFHEIKKAMENQRWYERKTIRYLKKMVELDLLEKQKIGIKGSRAFYKTTSKTHEYEVQSFFDRVRNESIKKDHVIRREDSFLVYGIPREKNLSTLENEILDQIDDRINRAFYDLYSLKQSITARMEAGQPMSNYLLLEFLLEKASNQFRQQLWNKVYETDTNDIENVLKFARQRKIEISNPEQWMSPDVPTYKRPRSGPLSTFEEARLAVLVMLNPREIGEYGYDSYNYLKKIIGFLETKKKTLSDSDLVIIATQFLKLERYRKMAYDIDQDIDQRILALKRWPWLKLKIGTETTEKLTKTILDLWRKRKETSKKHPEEMKELLEEKQ